jgi:hypothetical protein
VTTSRYDEATATLALRNGTATLSDARLSMPDYRLELAGTVLPFDDRLDLAARLVASPEETARLTDGKDRSAYLPYEDGGLMIPLAIRGPCKNRWSCPTSTSCCKTRSRAAPSPRNSPRTWKNSPTPTRTRAGRPAAHPRPRHAAEEVGGTFG